MPTEKPSLSFSRFIYLASTKSEFREKYMGKWDALKRDFTISNKDFEKLGSLDVAKLNKQIDEYGKLNMVKDNIDIVATHTKNSHVSHAEGAHSNSSHSNGADELVGNRLDSIVNTLKNYDMTITTRTGTTPIDVTRIPR